MNNIYLQQRHTVILDGVPIQGFAEGDWMGIKLEGAGASRSKGGDGPAMNVTTDQGGQITVTLNPTSPALGFFYGLRDAQKISPRFFSIIVMSGVGEVLMASGCAMGELAQIKSGGPTMQGREFVFECLKINMDTSVLEAAAGGFIGGLVG